MESRQDAEGATRGSHSIWCVRGRSLWKCSPEQLRPASEKEELLEVIASNDGEQPWTFDRLTSGIGGTQYEDITSEIPSEQEWRRAQDPVEEIPPQRHRISGKRPMGSCSCSGRGSSSSMEVETGEIADLAAGSSQPSRTAIHCPLDTGTTRPRLVSRGSQLLGG